MWWVILIVLLVIGAFIVLPYVLETRAENEYFGKTEKKGNLAKKPYDFSGYSSQGLQNAISEKKKTVEKLKTEIEKNMVFGVDYNNSLKDLEKNEEWIKYAIKELKLRKEYVVKTENDRKNKIFEDDLDDFYKLKFTFKRGRDFFVYSYRLVGEKGRERVNSNAYDIKNNKWTNSHLAELNARSFFNGLMKYKIGEWKENYNSADYGLAVLDGFSWKLEVKYYNKDTKEYSGQNALPYNIKEVLDFLEIDLDSTDWVELDKKELGEFISFDNEDKTLYL